MYDVDHFHGRMCTEMLMRLTVRYARVSVDGGDDS